MTQANKNINEIKNQYQLLQNENDFLKKKIINLEKENNTLKNKQNINPNENQTQELVKEINDLKKKNEILYNENQNFANAIKIKESEIINSLNLHQKETDEINKEINILYFFFIFPY